MHEHRPGRAPVGSRRRRRRKIESWVFDPPTPLDAALEDIESLLGSPALVLLGAGPRHQSHMVKTVRDGGATGNLAHDAHIAALAIEHGVKELWTLDRDFARFPGLSTRDPFGA